MKKYGVIVSCGSRRGLLLPDLEGVGTVGQQIDIALDPIEKKPPSVERVYQLADVAREYLPFVYTGNCCGDLGRFYCRRYPGMV